MIDTLVLMPGNTPQWLRISENEIVARGEGLAASGPDDHVVAIVPAHDVTIYHAALSGLSEPQALAAARLIVAEQSASSADRLHIAIGKTNGAGDRPVVAIDRTKMVALLAHMAAQGHDPDAVVALPMLLERPESGFVKGDFGNDIIVRGPDGAFADDPILTPLLTGGVMTVLSRATLERGLINAVADPEVDLRQGIFAKRRAWDLDWARLRRIGWLTLGLVVAILLYHIVQLVRLNLAADRLEASNIIVARSALPPGTTVNNPLLQVQDQLNALRGPGGGLLPLAAAVASATSNTPNLELTSLIFDGGGTLRVTVRAPTPTDLMIFEGELKNAGLSPASGPTLVDQGQQIRDYTVSVK